jgi:hypothetical protein
MKADGRRRRRRSRRFLGVVKVGKSKCKGEVVPVLN